MYIRPEPGAPDACALQTRGSPTGIHNQGDQRGNSILVKQGPYLLAIDGSEIPFPTTVWMVLQLVQDFFHEQYLMVMFCIYICIYLYNIYIYLGIWSS